MRNTYNGFTSLCRLVGFDLEPHQRKLARAAFEPQLELLGLLPKGNGKTTMLGALAVHHLLTVPNPAVYVAASSRDQAAILYEAARAFASHPALDGQVTLRHLELRVPGGHLRVLAADGPKLHGLTPTLAIVDELHAHTDDRVYVALRSAMLKRAGARLVVISTAGHGADTPLGRLRARALSLPNVKTTGSLTEAHGRSLRLLEWAVPDDADLDDPRVVKRANPASWITTEALAAQREALPDLAFRRYHANQWTAREGFWLPPGAWQACAGDTSFEPGERVWVGVDLSGGGGRSDTAVCWLNERLHVGCEIWSGEHEPVAEVLALLDDLASTYSVAEVTMDFWRAAGLAHELEERLVVVSSYPQTDSRLVPASQRLYNAITEGRLVHPDHPALNEHVAAAVAKHSRRGWRLDRADQPIDGTVALAMALDRAEFRAEPAKLLGWL